MNFFEAVKNRHSVRNYKQTEIEQEKIDLILNTVNAAPSAGNLQGYVIVEVRDQDIKDALSKASYGQPYVSQTPVVLVFCADHLTSASKYGSRGSDLYAIQDATIAAAYSQLAATSIGLATVWVGAFDPVQVGKAISAPEHVTPVAIIPIGYPNEDPAARPRRELHDLVRNEKF